MSQAELLRAAVALLDDAGIRHMVVGSYASSFHGEPRITRDIDLVVKLGVTEELNAALERAGALRVEEPGD